MSTNTPGTNAQALPEASNRRAVLRGVLAAGAVGATLALPAVAAASDAPSHHPDADLFALIERAKTANSVSTDACMAAADLLNETRPSFPQALVWTEADEPHWYGVRSGKRDGSDHRRQALGRVGATGLFQELLADARELAQVAAVAERHAIPGLSVNTARKQSGAHVARRRFGAAHC